MFDLLIKLSLSLLLSVDEISSILLLLTPKVGNRYQKLSHKCHFMTAIDICLTVL